MNQAEIKKLAQIKYRQIEAMRAEPRFRQVLGKLVHLKLLIAPDVTPFRGIVFLTDVLWAGDIEPRVFELLPAVLLKRPKAFTANCPLPYDLKLVLAEIKHLTAKTPFRGIPPENYLKWVVHAGRKGAHPTLMKTFRFNVEDLALINDLRDRTKKNEIDVLREALLCLKNKTD